MVKIRCLIAISLLALLCFQSLPTSADNDYHEGRDLSNNKDDLHAIHFPGKLQIHMKRSAGGGGSSSGGGSRGSSGGGSRSSSGGGSRGGGTRGGSGSGRPRGSGGGTVTRDSDNGIPTSGGTTTGGGTGIPTSGGTTTGGGTGIPTRGGRNVIPTRGRTPTSSATQIPISYCFHVVVVVVCSLFLGFLVL